MHCGAYSRMVGGTIAPAPRPHLRHEHVNLFPHAAGNARVFVQCSALVRIDFMLHSFTESSMTGTAPLHDHCVYMYCQQQHHHMVLEPVIYRSAYWNVGASIGG